MCIKIRINFCIFFKMKVFQIQYMSLNKKLPLYILKLMHERTTIAELDTECIVIFTILHNVLIHREKWMFNYGTAILYVQL